MAGTETWNGVVGHEARYKIRLLDWFDEKFKCGLGFLAKDGLLACSVIIEILATKVDAERSAEIGDAEITAKKMDRNTFA